MSISKLSYYIPRAYAAAQFLVMYRTWRHINGKLGGTPIEQGEDREYAEKLASQLGISTLALYKRENFPYYGSHIWGSAVEIGYPNNLRDSDIKPFIKRQIGLAVVHASIVSDVVFMITSLATTLLLNRKIPVLSCIIGFGAGCFFANKVRAWAEHKAKELVDEASAKLERTSTRPSAPPQTDLLNPPPPYAPHDS